MCAPSTPAAPDYVGAAQAQGGANVQSAIAQNVMNRPNETTPFGSRTWNQTGNYQIPGTNGQPPIDVPMYSSEMKLSPEAQQLYQRGINTLNQPSNMGSVQDIADQSYAAQTARLDPQWQQATTSKETQLTNQGLRPGDEAWTNAMRDFTAGKNDAYTQARLASIGTMPQTFQMEESARTAPLNELNAIRTGTQIAPQFQNFATGGLAAPNIAGAVGQQGAWQQGLYNAQAAQAANLQSGLFGLGGAGLLALAL